MRHFRDLEEDEITKPGIRIGDTMVPAASVAEIAPEDLLDEIADEVPVDIEEPSRYSVSGIISVPPTEPPQSRMRVTYAQILQRVWDAEE